MSLTAGRRMRADGGRAEVRVGIATSARGRGSNGRLVVGMACLWAWGYVATLSQSLFPSAHVVASIGVEYAYYASQLTLVALALAVTLATRRWLPRVSSGAVVAGACLLAATTALVALLLRLPACPAWALAVCGVAYGIGGLALTVAWGARASVGPAATQRLVLCSFLLAYGIYLGCLTLPLPCGRVVAIVLPLASGMLWLADERRRQRAASGAWPGEATSDEVTAGSTSAAILPWRTLSLLAVACLVGNFVSSYLMGASYGSARTIFVGAFLTCAALALATLPLVGDGSRTLSIERVYRYALPLAAAAMLLILAAPGRWTDACTAVLTGVGMFLQALVILKVCETTRATGVSPLLSFSVGQGLVGAVVAAGNVGGRVAAEHLAGDAWLAAACAIGVFALFCLLLMMADDLTRRLLRAGVAPGALPDSASALERDLVEGTAAYARADAASGARDANDAGDVETDAGAVAHAERLAAFSRLHGLTARETDVLAHLVRGRALAAIAERLCVSTGTVKTHALHIYAKTGVHSRQELMDLFEATAPDGREDVAPAGGPTGVSTSDASSQEVTYHATRIDEGQARARR